VSAVTLVGAGAAGVELSLAMTYRFRRELGERAPHVRLLGDTARVAPELARGARVRLARWLKRRNVGVHLGSRVVAVAERSLQTEHGMEFASDAVFWSAGGAAHPWIRDAQFAADERGFLAVNDFLQSESHPEVFGAGDCVTRAKRPYPKAGVFAVAAAPVLAANLRAALAGTALAPFERTRRYLALVSTGGRHAVGAWNGFAWSGGFAWRTKDRIDREFVARYAT
jgi:selenide, water dikinase